MILALVLYCYAKVVALCVKMAYSDDEWDIRKIADEVHETLKGMT